MPDLLYHEVEITCSVTYRLAIVADTDDNTRALADAMPVDEVARRGRLVAEKSYVEGVSVVREVPPLSTAKEQS